MIATNLTDIEKDGLEEVFSVFNLDIEEEKTLFTQIVTLIKNFIDNLL